MPSLSISRTIYDPATKGFITSTPDAKALPNIKQWINQHNPVIYWYVLRIDNLTDVSIDQWAVELYAHQALTITEAYIDGSDRIFELKKREKDAWNEKYVLSISRLLGIPIVGKGTRRIFFKVDIDCKEGLMNEYAIAGAFLPHDMEPVTIKDKMFQYSCKVGEFRQIFDKDPHQASSYAERKLAGKYSSNSVHVFTNSFRMIHELYGYCHSQRLDRDVLLQKLHLLHTSFEGVPEIAGERITPLIHDGIRELDVIVDRDKFAPRFIRLCDSLVELLHMEVMGADMREGGADAYTPSSEPMRMGGAVNGFGAGGQKECPSCGNIISESNKSLICMECGIHFCHTCEEWFRKDERKRGEGPSCKKCYTSEQDRIREEAERKVQLERERKEKEEQEIRRKEEAEKKARDETERKKKEEDERLRREQEQKEKERKAKEEWEEKKRQKELRKRQDAEKKARDEAERKKKEEEERLRREKERKAKEELDEKKRQEELRKKQEEENERLEKKRAEQERNEEGERLRSQKEEKERKAREEAERERQEKERLWQEKKEKQRKERGEQEEKKRQDELRKKQEAQRKEQERKAQAERERIERKAKEEREKAAKEHARREQEKQKVKAEQERIAKQGKTRTNVFMLFIVLGALFVGFVMFAPGSGDTHGVSSSQPEVVPKPIESTSSPQPEISTPAPSSNQKTYTNSIGMEFVLIPAGSFDMGSPSGEDGRYDDEGPVHKVNIQDGFYLGKYEVTREQWREVMGDDPSTSKGDRSVGLVSLNDVQEVINKKYHPVETISWVDAQEFIKKLNQKEGVNKYRLPSEAEWEYAARAGTTTRYSFGDDDSELGDYAWQRYNSDSKTHPVGQKKPNLWGLYDMHGNVWEWVQDKWNDDYGGAPTDGSAWESGDDPSRVHRGGCWSYYASDCRSARRGSFDPDRRYDGLGFRLLRGT